MLIQDEGLKIAQNNAGYDSAAAFLHMLCGSPRILSGNNMVCCLLSWFTSVTKTGASAFFLTHFSFPYVSIAASHGGPSRSQREQCRPSLATSFSLPPRQSSSVQSQLGFFSLCFCNPASAQALPCCIAACGIDIIFRPKSFELPMFFPRHPLYKSSHKYWEKNFRACCQSNGEIGKQVGCCSRDAHSNAGKSPPGAEPQMKHAVRTSPIWGSLGSAQLLRVRLQGMNSTRHIYHVTKHSGLWLNNTEAATQAHKLSTVALRAALAPGAEVSLGAQLHMVPLSPLPASPSPLTSQYLHFGPQDGQGSSSGSTTPAQTKQTLPGTRWAELGSSLTCSHLCGCVWASPVQIHPTVHELSPALFGYDQNRNSEMQRREPVTTYQYLSLFFLSERCHQTSL